MQYDQEQINHLIRNRRSIFPNQFSNEKVPEEIIKQMLENANWAPTHRLTEPWRFTVFTDEGLTRLAKFQSELYRQVSEANGSFSESKFKTLSTKPQKASHIIAIGMKRTDSDVVPEVEEIEAVACAVQNMYLTATAYGVGCYWGSGGITYLDEAKSFFGLEKQDKFLGFLFVGMPSREWPKGRRKAIDDKVTWVTTQ